MPDYCRSTRVPSSRATAAPAVLFLAVLLLAAGCAQKQGKSAGAPVPVTVAVARRASVPYTVAANGIVTPLETATVAPQVDGIVTEVAFREGQEVARGDALFRIEPRPYLAAYRQALAALARDSATAANARREVARYDSLAQKEYVTQEQADQFRATASAADATVKADESAVVAAKFNLDNTVIRAPIAGRTGSLLVRTGNVIHAAGGTPLVVINQIRPILVRFAVPGSELPLIQRYGAGKALPVSAVPGRSPIDAQADTTLGGPGGPTPVAPADPPPAQALTAVPAAQGALAFIDNAVDTTTGTVMLKASFPNREGSLWPGQFAAVSLRMFVEENALVVPAQAVLTGQQGTYVYLVDSTGAARQRRVAVERTADTLVVIAGGLRDGEHVVTTGQSRVTPGARVATTRRAGDSSTTPAEAGAAAATGRGAKRAR
jgi:multidrug efflux system membrane fusion protein